MIRRAFETTGPIDAGQPPAARASGAVHRWRWPDDYVSLGGGHLRVRRDYVSIFRRRGWNDLAALLGDDSEIELVRTVTGSVAERDNCRVRLPLPSGEEGVAYLKRHRVRARFGPLVRWVTGRMPAAPGIDEADAVEGCREANVPTMSVIAAGSAFDPARGETRSLFLSEAIADGKPADDAWRERFGTASPTPSERETRRRFLAALADTARRLHRANLFHRDFYWCHFFIREPARGSFVAHLIDLQRIERSRWLRWRWLLKDLAQFRFSAPTGATEEELRYWFRRYLQVESLRWTDRLGLWLIGVRARFYRWKEGAE